VSAKLLFREPALINCPEAVRAVLNASAQRLRMVSGSAFEDRIEVAEFVAADPITQSLLSTLRDFAVLDGTTESRRLKHVCLVGERGVGKEVLARLIHNWSGRAEEPFVAVNFGAVSKEIAAAEVFGARKGSYSGSVADRRGYIQQAEGGTLFLDELDEATDSVQALIKRAVEYGVFNVVGDPSESRANIRYVAATNVVDIDSLRIKRDLKDRFLLLRVPPLRERRADIRPLAEKFAADYGVRLPEPVMAFLEQLDWPGNVRQLRNVIERSCAVSSGPVDLTLELVQRSAMDDGAIVAVDGVSASDFVPLRNGETLEMRVDDVEKRHILAALEFCGGNKTHAAQALGMTRQSLLTRIKKFGL
jgi:DNA-binding NtrC family response regulator